VAPSFQCLYVSNSFFQVSTCDINGKKSIERKSSRCKRVLYYISVVWEWKCIIYRLITTGSNLAKTVVILKIDKHIAVVRFLS